MLRSFRVANHRSIRDEQELVLLPAYDTSADVVPVAAIFGANAAGKSNVLDALKFLQHFVRDSYRTWEPGTPIPRTPFRLDPATTAEPSTYVVDLLLDSVRYVYGIALDDHVVTDEWLHRYPQGRRQVVLERTGKKVRLGSTLPDYRGRQALLSKLTRDNASALGTAAMVDLAEIEPVYDWFRSALRVEMHPTMSYPPLARVIRHLEGGGADRARLVDLLHAADLGITDVGVDRVPFEDSRAMMERERITVLKEALAEARDESQKRTLQMELLAHEDALRSRPSIRSELRFRHGEHRVPMSVQEQSAGTLAWLDLVISALISLDEGSVLCVDEIDASLHPRLTARLVGMFKDVQSNPRAAQLIFTTHDAALLGTALGGEVLARDEVWFVEKGVDGATKLFALTDFKPRQHENTERRYLGGSYGAVPVVGDDDLWRAVIAHTETA